MRAVRFIGLIMVLGALAPAASAGLLSTAAQCDAGTCQQAPATGDCGLGPACPLVSGNRAPCIATLCDGPMRYLRSCQGSAFADCWTGMLLPPADEDTIDAFTIGLPAGGYRFALTQPPESLWDYTLCVYPPGAAREANARHPGDPEIVHARALVEGGWTLVVTSSWCPDGLPEDASGRDGLPSWTQLPRGGDPPSCRPCAAFGASNFSYAFGLRRV